MRKQVTRIAIIAAALLGAVAVVFVLTMPATPTTNGGPAHGTAAAVSATLRAGGAGPLDAVAQQTVEAAVQATATALEPAYAARERNIANNEADLRSVIPLIVAGLTLVVITLSYVVAIMPVQNRIAEADAELKQLKARNQLREATLPPESPTDDDPLPFDTRPPFGHRPPLGHRPGDHS